MDWVIGLILGVVSLLGIGKLLELAFRARQERRAVKKALDTSNAAKEIDADINAFEAINTRLRIVEERLDAVNDQLTEQRVENAKLEAENERLTKDNIRQEKEIERQRERIHDLANNINGKEVLILEMKEALRRSDAVILALKSELNATTMEVHDLSRRLKELTAG